jgi:outer membrane protein assembly factor BamB
MVMGAAVWAVAVAPASAARADWATFGGSLARQGSNPREHRLTPRRVVDLRPAWRVRVDGAVNTQPVLAHGVAVAGRRRDLLYVGTEHGGVVAVDARAGRVVWRRRLGATRPQQSNCAPSPDDVFGVTGTPVLDRRRGRLYVLDGEGRAWALALRSGRTARGWPVQVTAPGTAEYVWGALALARGRLYVPIASPCDAGFYRGGVAAVDVRDPRAVLRWAAVPPPGRGGGIWGWGGVAVDQRDGDVYAATGNASAPLAEDAGYAEAVVRLGRDLRVEQSNDPLHGPFAIADRDFGATPVLLQAKGCPRQLVALNKTGEVFLYDRDRLAAGPRQRLLVAGIGPGGVPLYGLPAFDRVRRMLVLVAPENRPPAQPQGGILGLRLTHGCGLAQAWRRPFDLPGAGSAPTVAAGVAYVGSGRSGRLLAYTVASGRRLWKHRLSGAAFAAPTVLDGSVYAADWSGRVWAFRAR